MEKITIRPAGLDDFEAVAHLLAELGRPALAGDTVDAGCALYQRYLARADTAPLVAEVAGVVVGFMSLEFRERLNRSAPQAWIPDLIVTAASRGLGAGRALLLRGFDMARERSCCNVTLESGSSRAVAHQLYRSAGMVEEGLFFTLHL